MKLPKLRMWVVMLTSAMWVLGAFLFYTNRDMAFALMAPTVALIVYRGLLYPIFNRV